MGERNGLWAFGPCSVFFQGSWAPGLPGRSDIERASFQVVCPFAMDQFYWAERMHWLGLAPEPLQRGSLVPEDDDAATIERAAHAVMGAIESALSPGVRSRAAEVADRVSMEVLSSLCQLFSVGTLAEQKPRACPGPGSIFFVF